MSTYSTNLKIELIGTGEQVGTWGTTTNDNFSNVFETAIVGRATVNFATDANLTLSISDSVAAQEYRNVYLNLTSGVSLSATRQLIVPTINKNYIIQNNTTGSQSITVKTSAGTGITVPNGATYAVYVDGTNVIKAFDYGLVTGVSVATANGLAGTSNGNATNPTLTLSTTVSGLVKGNGTALSAAVAGTDYAAATTGTNAQLLANNGSGGFNNVTVGSGLSYTGGTLNTVNNGTVTAVSVATANGLAGTSSGGTTPALTLSTTVTGVLKGNGTAISAAVAGTDYAPATSGTAILKGSGTGGFSNAVAGTDYAPATSGTAILKGSGTGGFSNAVAGTDYAPATSGTALLKGNGSGGFSNAVASTDYAVPTTGTNTQLLANNGTGGFSNVTVGSGLTYAAGTLTATGTGGTVTTVSVASANGFAGTVANATTTPAITLTTSVTGLLKGNGTAISAASSGTDYAPATSGTSILYGDGSGGFSNVTVGTGLNFAAGSLTNSGVTGLTAGTGISLSGATGSVTVTNSAPDQVVSIASGSGISVTGTYPNFTVAATGGSMVYPAAGIAVSTGSAWGTSLTAPSGTIVGTTDTQTLTNKRINLRVSSTASTSSLTVDSDTTDQAVITALAAGLTVNAPTGTPVNGQKLTLRFKDNGTARSIGWNAAFRAIGVTLPTTTVASKVVYIGCIYNSDESTWDVVSVAQQA